MNRLRDDHPWVSTGWHSVQLKESTCNIHRVKDVIDVTSDEVKDFIAENHIELVNQRDVLYGTHEYQDHLRDIGSPMWAGNWE